MTNLNEKAKEALTRYAQNNFETELETLKEDILSACESGASHLVYKSGNAFLASLLDSALIQEGFNVRFEISAPNVYTLYISVNLNETKKEDS